MLNIFIIFAKMYLLVAEYDKFNIDEYCIFVRK